jgi:hypothetical protein
MAGADTINYSLRPNKNVERKIIFDGLRLLDPAFPFDTYRYIGLGSMWFIDFILAHRTLAIRDMVSIEKNGEKKRRAVFNAPYRTIDVREGDSSVILPKLDLAGGPAILWLDYEKRLGAVRDELTTVCEQLPSGSVLVVTINATRDAFHVETTTERQRLLEEAFRRDVGSLAPAEFPNDFFDIGQFERNVGRTLIALLERATRKSGRDARFTPIFHFAYKDNAQMVTVGGMIVNRADNVRLHRLNPLEIIPFATGSEQTVIDVPPLTTREKLAIDRLLPSDEPPNAEALNAIGVPLKPSAIQQYHWHYLRYPVFAEFLP